MAYQGPTSETVTGGTGTMRAEATIASPICASLLKRRNRTLRSGSGGLFDRKTTVYRRVFS